MRTTMIRPALVLLVGLSVVTGLIYPLAVTGVGQLLFPTQANGSLVERDGRVVGSALIGQSFVSPGYFLSRPSATGPTPYNAGASSGSNLAPTNPVLVDAVRQRAGALRAADPGNAAPIPVDLVTASASGLDPEISLAAAYYQVGRVARERGVPEADVRALVDARAARPLAGVFGETRVNVLALNIALDDLALDGGKK